MGDTETKDPSIAQDVGWVFCAVMLAKKQVCNLAQLCQDERVNITKILAKHV